MSQDAGHISNYNFRHFFLRKASEKMALVDSATILNASGDKNAEEDGQKLIEEWDKEAQ